MKDARGFLKHASLSSNDGLVINVEGSEKMRSCACRGRLGVDSSPDLRGGSSSSSKGQAPYGGGAGFAPGPGLGESFLTWDGSQYLAHGSEAGILILLPRTSVKSVCCIIFFLVSDTWEWSVCSGIGVPNIYEF